MGRPLVKDPKYESWALLLLYFVFKTLRTYFVIWGYYFTPITALYFNLHYNIRWSTT